MPQRCCVPMCNTSGGHRFPKDSKRKKEWLKAICRDNLVSTDSARVCRSHFVPEDYADDRSQNRGLHLKKDAVPSIFVWNTNSKFDDKKDDWRQTKILYRKRRSRRANKRNYKLMEKGEMSAIKEKETNHSTSKTKNNFVKSESSMDQSASVKDETVKTDLKSDLNGDQISECRACLQELRVDRLFSLFQGWAPTWEGMGPTVAEDLFNFSNVQVSESDIHSKFICYTCCEKLWNACHFKMLVQDNDRILRQRISDDSDKVWPKPIQVDKSINGVYENILPFNIDIKQEVLTDEEAGNMDEGYTETHLMEIKVEPEEIVEQAPIIVNGVTSLKEFPNGEIATQLMNGQAELNGEKQLLNGETKTEDEYLKPVKEEPVSDSEDLELSLECLLCMKTFHSVTGLKAHVIAQHSYKTVDRNMGDKPDSRTSNKHVCATCRRTFTTSTDLMVHETCHGAHACYSCGARFDAFAALGRHRRRCRAPRPPLRPRALVDLVRPQVDDSLSNEDRSRNINTVTDVKEEEKLMSCPMCNEIFTDVYYVKIHQEIHHPKEENSDKMESEPAPMEIEMLESIFNEET